MYLFSDEDIKLLSKLSPKEQKEILRLLEAYDKSSLKESARNRFVDFVKYVWPESIISAHHKIIGEIFDDIVAGKKKRVILNMPPRVGKSLLGSKYLPAFFLGKHPDQHVVQATHTADFSIKWAKDVRDLIQSDKYREVFPGVALKSDTKAAGFWKTSHGGEYFAIGTGGNLAGRNAKLLIIDDPHSEQEGKLAAFKPEIFDQAYEWYLLGPRQRMEPDSRMLIIQTRWGMRDLTGRILESMKRQGVEQFEVIEFPAILPDGSKCIFPEARPMEYWLSAKSEMTASYWNCVYQQNPTSDEAALVKREWWRPWPEGKPPPECEFILQSWDTAYQKTERSDFSACTTWGVFRWMSANDKPIYNIILLDSFFERLEFPDLKRKAIQLYKDWKADNVIVETRAAGAPLVYELRATGIPVQTFSPSRGNDKIVRLNAVSDLFRSGMVWVDLSKKSNEHTVEQTAAFPNGDHDDLVDTLSQALLRFRRGGFIRSDLDDNFDEDQEREPREAAYY